MSSIPSGNARSTTRLRGVLVRLVAPRGRRRGRSHARRLDAPAPPPTLDRRRQDQAEARPAAGEQGRGQPSGSASTRPTCPRPRKITGLERAGPGRLRRADRRRREPARRRPARCLTARARRTSRSGTNAIRVDAGDAALVDRLASRATVRRALPDARLRGREADQGRADIKQVNAVEWGIANINADDVWNQFGVTGRGHHRGQHRHRRPVRPPGAGQPVPRQQRRRHVRPQLQLVRRRRHLRRRARATPTATAPTPWARWSATTAAPTRSASPPARSGSRPTAAARPTRP